MTTPAEQSRSLGRYQLLFLLGQGGMGEVHLARLSGAAGFEKLCIVKTVLPNLMGDQQFIERFHHEARVLVQLTHSNIAQVYDMGEFDGTLYMAIEYVPGVDLSRVETRVERQGAQMPLQMAVYIGQRMTEALGYAHRKAGADGQPLGIVHRDVSPQNVMVSYEGEVKVIDFGLAKSSARSKHTLPSTVMGKLGYMSPEQALAKTVDHRSDIFSAGIVVWEMLAGHAMYRGGTMSEMVAQMAMGEVPSLRAARPDISDTLEQVVMRALAKDPAARYQRADDFARALNELAVREGLSVGAEDVGNYVRAMCPEEFAAERQLQSKLSVMRKRGSDAVEVGRREPEMEGTFLKPSQQVNPQTVSGQIMTPAMRAMSLVQPSTPPAAAPAARGRSLPPQAQEPGVELVAPKSRLPLVIAGLLGVIALAGGALFVLGKEPRPAPNPAPVVTTPPQVIDAGPAVAAVTPEPTTPEPEPAKPEPEPEPVKAEPQAIEQVVVTGPVWKVIRKGDESFILLGSRDKVRGGDRLNLVGEPEADGKKRPVYAHGAVLEVKGSLASILVDDDVPLPEKLFAARDTAPRPPVAVATAKVPKPGDTAAPAPDPTQKAEPAKLVEVEPEKAVDPAKTVKAVDPVKTPEPAKLVEPAKPVEPSKPAPQQIYGSVRISVGAKLTGNRAVLVRSTNKMPLIGCELRLPSNMVFRFGSRQIQANEEVKLALSDFRKDSRPADPRFREDWAAMYCKEGTGYWQTTYDRR